MTVVELLISVVMSLLVVGAAMEFYVVQHKSWLIEQDTAELQQNARAAMDDVVAALRMGGYGIAGSPGYTAAGDSLSVYFLRNAASDTVVYRIAVDTDSLPCLTRHSVGNSAQVLAEGIESLSITPVSAQLVQVSVTARSVKPDTPIISGDGYRRRTVSSTVRLRNLSL